MYVTDVPVIDRLTADEIETRAERWREVQTDRNLDVHVWAARHTGRSYVA